MNRPMKRIAETAQQTGAEVAEAADAVQNAAGWLSAFMAAIYAGRQVQFKLDLKRALAGEWGGLEARLAPLPEPDPNPENEVTG